LDWSGQEKGFGPSLPILVGEYFSGYGHYLSLISQFGTDNRRCVNSAIIASDALHLDKFGSGCWGRTNDPLINNLPVHAGGRGEGNRRLELLYFFSDLEDCPGCCTVVRIGSQLEAGTVWLNEVHQYSPFQAFSGHKNSGLGCENSLHGLMEYTNWQSITMKRAL